MTKKSSEKETKENPAAPNVILVSQDFTNGLYNMTRDREALVTALMEHVLVPSFTCAVVDSDANCEDFIGDFALFGIETKSSPCIEFTKTAPVLYPAALFETVLEVRKEIELPDLGGVSLAKFEQVCQGSLTKMRSGLKIAIGQLLDEASV
jgi:hypothetical protein